MDLVARRSESSNYLLPADAWVGSAGQQRSVPARAVGDLWNSGDSSVVCRHPEVHGRNGVAGSGGAAGVQPYGRLLLAGGAKLLAGDRDGAAGDVLLRPRGGGEPAGGLGAVDGVWYRVVLQPRPNGAGASGAGG